MPHRIGGRVVLPIGIFHTILEYLQSLFCMLSAAYFIGSCIHPLVFVSSS